MIWVIRKMIMGAYTRILENKLLLTHCTRGITPSIESGMGISPTATITISRGAHHQREKSHQEKSKKSHFSCRYLGFSTMHIVEQFKMKWKSKLWRTNLLRERERKGCGLWVVRKREGLRWGINRWWEEQLQCTSSGNVRHINWHYLRSGVRGDHKPPSVIGFCPWKQRPKQLNEGTFLETT